MKEFLLACFLLAAGGFGWAACCRLDGWILHNRQARDRQREKSRDD